MNKLSDIIASVFYIGYFPIAPGTLGSMAAVFLIFSISCFVPNYSLVVSGIGTLSTFFIGAWAAKEVTTNHNVKDPGYIVIDEWSGMFISFLFVPITLSSCVLAFILFRFFDIVKIWPASYFDKQSNHWAIMLDDIVAGLYTAFILLIVHSIYKYS